MNKSVSDFNLMDLEVIECPFDFYAAARLGHFADQAKIPNAVEEISRMETPTACLWRVVTQDTEMHGVHLPKGARLMVRIAAANRDEQVFDNPERLDVCRQNAADNLAFGQGVHFCPGAQLARKEMNIALSHLLDRTCNWRLTEGRNNQRHWPNLLLRGLEALHISFDESPAI